MSSPLLPSDGPGYIYALELADPARPDLIRIKVGRSIDVQNRLSQHRNQCPTSKPKLLGYFPARALSRRSPAVPFCDRLERLVHIELADLSARSYPPARGAPRTPCIDCGRRHAEIFVFKRLQGRLHGKEWERIIRPVIKRWARFDRRLA